MKSNCCQFKKEKKMFFKNISPKTVNKVVLQEKKLWFKKKRRRKLMILWEKKNPDFKE